MKALARRLGLLALVGCWAFAAAGPVAATHSLGPMPAVPLISADYVHELLSAREPVMLIDLRPTHEYEVSRLPRARSVPLSELRNRYAEIPRSGRVVLYCRCQPGEDWHGYELLRVRGYLNIVVLAGGFSRWLERGYPLENS